MRVKFWGVRGSIPAPLTGEQVQAKITAAVQRIGVKDLSSSDARERFLSNLPEWIFGTVGGNTPCVELKGKADENIILDAGSGIRAYGKKGEKPSDNHYNIFFSHFHWDHIQGFPFFDPIYDGKASFDIYSGFENFSEYFEKQQDTPFFPESASFKSVQKNMKFHTLSQGKPFVIGGITVKLCRMNHPGNSFSYSFEENGKKFVFATDVELSEKDYEADSGKEAVFRNADAVVLDAQYTVEESYRKANWGHSAFCSAIDFSVHWGIKTLYLFHHEPSYDDKKIASMLTAARWYAQYIVHSDIKIFLATEGLEFEV